jgi:hypothetical protein
LAIIFVWLQLIIGIRHMQASALSTCLFMFGELYRETGLNSINASNKEGNKYIKHVPKGVWESRLGV